MNIAVVIDIKRISSHTLTYSQTHTHMCIYFTCDKDTPAHLAAVRRKMYALSPPLPHQKVASVTPLHKHFQTLLLLNGT